MYAAVAPLLSANAPPGLPPASCAFGTSGRDTIISQDNDPTALAGNLNGTRLFIASGNGRPGPLDTINAGTPVAGGVESVVWLMNEAFDAALRANHVPHTTYFYGPGTHVWAYWQRDLKRFLAWLGPQLTRPPAQPPTFSIHRAERAFTAWGWQFAMRRRVREFVYITAV